MHVEQRLSEIFIGCFILIICSCNLDTPLYNFCALPIKIRQIYSVFLLNFTKILLSLHIVFLLHFPLIYIDTLFTSLRTFWLK